MKSRFVDPFSPNRPIDDPLRFAGRSEQVEEVVDSLYQIANGNPKHTVITGNRGIGKSSLLFQAKLLAEGDTRLPDKLGIQLSGQTFNFATGWHDCVRGQDVPGVMRGLAQNTQGKLIRLLGKVDLKLNVLDILSVGAKEQGELSLSDYVTAFTDDAKATADRLTARGSHTGLIYFVDELDRVDPDSGIASFFKLTSERLSRDGYKNVAFFAAGITGAVQQLEDDHASIVRTFRDVPITLWSESESTELLRTGFDAVKASYDRAVFDAVFKLSAGYPEPLHLIGSELLSVDADDHLDLDDLEAARKKVVSDVRRNKLQSLLRNAGSGKYQKILLAMANYKGPNVPLAHISQEIGYEQNQYSSNMGTLVDRNIVTRLSMGVYGFVDPLLREYIREFGIIDADPDAEG